MYIFLLQEVYNNLVYNQVFIFTASDDRISQEKHTKQKHTIFSVRPRLVLVFEAIWTFVFNHILMLHNNPGWEATVTQPSVENDLRRVSCGPAGRRNPRNPTAPVWTWHIQTFRQQDRVFRVNIYLQVWVHKRYTSGSNKHPKTAELSTERTNKRIKEALSSIITITHLLFFLGNNMSQSSLIIDIITKKRDYFSLLLMLSHLVVQPLKYIKY